ncbi:secreted RxLR effector protein 161-like [Cicer arietinum]|uniref:secreted RxLR effector protein 161-like n=1 Tax=Cicer arietinum TaxID=3827 RepID=UPI003CC6C6B7
MEDIDRWKANTEVVIEYTTNNLESIQNTLGLILADPKESHLVAVKRIMKYLKGATNVGLWYPKGTICSLVGYSDLDYAGCKTDRKSTSGTCHILGNALVSWSCKKQACVALSTAKAEYIAT